VVRAKSVISKVTAIGSALAARRTEIHRRHLLETLGDQLLGGTLVPP